MFSLLSIARECTLKHRIKGSSYEMLQVTNLFVKRLLVWNEPHIVKEAECENCEMEGKHCFNI